MCSKGKVGNSGGLRHSLCNFGIRAHPMIQARSRWTEPHAVQWREEDSSGHGVSGFEGKPKRLETMGQQSESPIGPLKVAK